MYSTSTQVPPLNTYSGGRLSEGAYGVVSKMQTFGSMIGHPPPQTIQMRQFVTGEKFWVTKIDVQGDGGRFLRDLQRRDPIRNSVAVLFDAEIYLSTRHDAQQRSGA